MPKFVANTVGELNIHLNQISHETYSLPFYARWAQKRLYHQHNHHHFIIIFPYFVRLIVYRFVSIISTRHNASDQTGSPQTPYR
jgi:hypothetical protein